MSVFTLQNWKFGLDTRRSELTSQPGTLETATDVHINQGAEVEKRKAFVPAVTNLASSEFSANVFGLEVSGGSLVAFGSAASGAVTVPAGVTYLQCAHPTDSTKSMTAIVCSCSFGGQAFCVAQFGTEYYWYLNGVVIPASIAGLILTTAGGGTSQTIKQIVAQLYNILSGSSYSDAGIFVNQLTNTGFNLYTAYGVTWTPVIAVTSANGAQITASLFSTGTAPVNASNGAAQLTLYAGSTGSIATLTDVATGTSGTTTYNLISAAVPYVTSPNQTISNLAAKINSSTTAPLSAAASSSAGTVNITTALSLPNNYLSYVVTGNLCFENMAFDCSGVNTLQTAGSFYASSGANAIPSTQEYGTSTGEFAGNPSGTSVVCPAFVLAYGTYLWIPGSNDTKIIVNTVPSTTPGQGTGGTTYTKATYPNGVVVTYTTNAILFVGTKDQPNSGQLFPMTTLFTLSNTYPLGGTLATIATQLTAIAAQITSAGAGGFVASSNAATLPASGANTTLYVSRKALAVNAVNYAGLYYYSNITNISPVTFSSAAPPTAFGFGQTVAAVTGQGTNYTIQFTGNWTAGDQYSFQIVTPSVTYDIGTGRLTGLVPVACMTLSNRVHVLAGSLWTGSDNGDATQWEQQAPGAFQIDVSQQFRQADQLISLAAYQGRIALFANYVIMIWILDANPLNIAMQQAMANVGTFSPLGPQSLGDFDVIFPCVTGFRSLRVRDLSLNAYVNDLGSPVDLLVQQDITTVGFGNLSSSCGIVEPSANRYWLYLNGHIYVLSYFPSAKINAAWSEYSPVFYVGSTQHTFVPVKFIVYNSQVYFLATYAGNTYLFVFGGTNNNTYDITPATVATPWLDMGAATFRKTISSLDFAMTNSWQFALSMDYYGYVNNAATLKNVVTSAVSNPSFQLGSYSISQDGYHIKLQATCAAAGYAVLSALDVHYQKREEKK